MPFKVKKIKGGFAVFNQDTGKQKNKKPMTKVKASKYLKALYANSKDI
jgi:hypothetical protein